MKPLRVAIIAPPWLAVPAKGYGGIELVLESLIYALRREGVDIVLYGNKEVTPKGIETRGIYEHEIYGDIYRPLNDSLPLASAHMLFAINDIIADGGFDIVHNHLEYIGPQILTRMGRDLRLPPVIHTHHGPPFSSVAATNDLPDTTVYWEQLARDMGRLRIVGVSDALMKPAPALLKRYVLPSVHNAIEIKQFPYHANKKKYFYTMARFNQDKAQHIAAKICAEKGYQLRMAGTVAGIGTNAKLLSELANPMSQYRNMGEFRYYSDFVLPYVIENPNITYSGNVSGTDKTKLMSNARALLFPICWEEPFGMAVIEALACGTPVVAMKRGAMAEIITHGVNGFLARSEKEFSEYMDRVGEIDPVECRKSVEQQFTARGMARNYIDRYRRVIQELS